MNNIKNKNEKKILIILALIMNIDILYLLYPFYGDMIFDISKFGLFEILEKHHVRLSITILSLLSTTSFALIIHDVYNAFFAKGNTIYKAKAKTILIAIVLTVISVAVHYYFFEDLEINVSNKITVFRLFIWYGARATYMSLIVIYISDLNIKKNEERAKKSIINKLELENSFTKYSMLKEQINPHFIFNTINTLNALIQSEDKNAINYITNISNILNYSFSEQDLATLPEELEIAKSYAHLIQMRYRNNVVFNFYTNNCKTYYRLPIFALQTLLENAIKHNKITINNHLHITINCHENYIEVINNVSPKIETYESTGIGLFNLSQRYKLLANKEITIKSNNNYFMVQLPYI